MRVLRRRAAAMSPREKHLALLSALGLVSFALYYSPAFFYLTLILAVCCIVCYYHSGEPLPARLGLNPGAGLTVPAVLRRWFWGWGLTGVSVAARGKTKTSRNKAELRHSEGHFRDRFSETGIYRRENLNSDSFLFSPRDFLMGSYIVKPESPTIESGRPRVARNPREQLREKLSRPNHAVHTPNRRLSFAGEPLGTVSRFTITPQRHYPLQQPGVSSVGVLPPVRWDGFRKKNILSPRNSPAALSPVTVKIARPDHHSTPSLDHLSCTGLSRAPADPCSRESVLKVLKESRKREVEDEDRSFTIEQRSKRRRNDSGGSSHSAFGPLLPNGAPSQLVPKPGNLKRGMSSLAEESIMKRSRTSSISSISGVHSPRGTPGTRRNPIHSSYSSSIGLSQWKKRSAPSSPLSSPGSSRCQTPEGVSKRPREDEGQSPSSASSVRSDHTASDKAPVTSKLTPAPKVPVTPSAGSTGSGGKRKRKIQLVSSNRDDQISLPPPPELGYTITVKDLDEEKKAAISKIQKVLETPAPEPEKSVSPPATTSAQPASTTSSTNTTTLSSLLAAPLSIPTSSSIPVINLDPSPSSSVTSAPAIPNPLLEALKKSSSPAPVISTPAAISTPVSASTTPAQPSGLTLKVSTAVDSPLPPPPYQPQSSSAGGEQPSAFTQVLSQISKAPSSTPPLTGASLIGLTSQNSTSTSSSASIPSTAPAVTQASSLGSFSNTNPLLASGFKPIFAVTPTSSGTPTPETKPAVHNFKPIFGVVPEGSGFGQPTSITTTNQASTASITSTPSMFGGSMGTTTVTPSVFPGMTNTLTGPASTGSITTTQPAAQPAVKSLFGSWSAPSTTSTSSAPTQAPNTGSTFSFGSAPTTTTAAAPAPAPTPAPTAATTAPTNSTFGFGATQPDPQAASQKVFAFGQAVPMQNTTTASFGGFGMANTASTTTAAPTTQSTFAFGKSSFPAPAAPTAQSAFGSSAATPKPFTFGNSPAPSAPAANTAPPPFPFGSTAVTTAPSFGTPAPPAFGGSATGFAFGNTTAPSAAPTAAPSFGAAAQTQSASTASFAFGNAAPQPAPPGPAQPAPSGFNFGAGMQVPQFGTPVSNNPAPQMGSFNFGAAATDKPAFGKSTPSFGQGAAAAPSPFGSPGTPVQGFNAVPFGSPAAPSFSIGAGSKPSGARQRLQARRQHNRKK
ncbi:nuclear envelope pore membrane protein POM 121 [Notolabrus celidotus]|uniref:nuclear envelope pore membrane protein POM 121 n=1 Tax=Notolabrus celidotus TaxID=1203425 RepID=UPI00148F8C06|nr:nuclear envelope pore membrane protein POM 121 [Notolabrus celidotus]